MESSTGMVKRLALPNEEEAVGPDRQVLPRRSTRRRHTAPPRRSILNPLGWFSDDSDGPAKQVSTDDEYWDSTGEGSSDDDFIPKEEEENNSSMDDETADSRSSNDVGEVSIGRGRMGRGHRRGDIPSQMRKATNSGTTGRFVPAPAPSSHRPDPVTPPPKPSRATHVPQAPAKAITRSFATHNARAYKAPVRRKYGNLKISAELDRCIAKGGKGTLSRVENTRFAALRVLESFLAASPSLETGAEKVDLGSLKQVLEDNFATAGDVAVPDGPWPYYRIGPKLIVRRATLGDGVGGENYGKRKRDISEPQESSLEPTPKKKKPWTRTKVHVPVDLAILRPQPTRLTFPPHPEEDRSDEWYIAQFDNLFTKLDEFAEDFFAVNDLAKGQFHQLWALDMAPEFLNYVEQVAEPDVKQGGWDAMLRNTKQRKLLIKAVVMRVLENKVFGAELLGATPQEDEMMMSLERGLFTREGFVRQQLRSQQVRTILGFGCITRDFHSAIAQLTAQITLLLHPLSDYLYAIPPEPYEDDPSKTKPNPTINEQYQALHDIISMAGYLSIAIRLSPTIFFFNSADPGDHWQNDDHISVDEEAYSASKAFLEEPYQLAFDIWKADYDMLQAQLEAAEPKLRFMKEPQTEAGKTIAAQMKAMREDPSRPISPSYTHRALVKIGILPNIRRFKPGGQMDDDANEPLHSRSGFRIREIRKAHVLCYFGDERMSERAKLLECLSLHDFVSHCKRRYRGNDAVSSWSQWVAAGFTGAVFGAVALKYLGVEPDFVTAAWPSVNLRYTLLGEVRYGANFGT